MDMNEVKTEYFELLRRLNKSNKAKNTTTKLDFIIDQNDEQGSKLCASISKNQKILLCIKDGHEWNPAKFSGLDHLEQFISNQLKYVRDVNITDLILRNLFKHIE